MSSAPLNRNRASLLHKVRYALRNPGKVGPYLRRSARDLGLRLRHRDHVSYYRAVMAADTARDPRAAVGSRNEERWLELGRMQFDYLFGHGLLPGHRLLEIGCGNLRAGWRFIDHLDIGGYYGIDISPDILISAKETLTARGLQDKLPHLTLVRDLTFDFLPDGYFDVVHAHSVFSHCPIEVIEECLRNIGRIMKPDGFFDFTFNATGGPEHHVEHEDYYYRPATLIRLAEGFSLQATFMEDWEGRHPQSKLRIRRHL
jgi:SAM-dependent methyltransferase